MLFDQEAREDADNGYNDEDDPDKVAAKQVFPDGDGKEDRGATGADDADERLDDLRVA